MATLVTSFFIGYSSSLQITRTCIKAWLSSNFGQMPPLTTELAALERLKINVKCCGHSSAFTFDRTVLIFAGNEYNHKIMAEFE